MWLLLEELLQGRWVPVSASSAFLVMSLQLLGRSILPCYPVWSRVMSHLLPSISAPPEPKT